MDISRPASQTIPAAEPARRPVAGAEPAAGPERSFAAVLAEGPTLEASAGERQGRGPIATPIRELEPPVPSVAAGDRPGRARLSWQRLADNALAAEGRIDSMIEAGRRGEAFTATELIGLQLEVFRYSQTVEVISRTTDKIVGAVKQVLGTQV